MEGSLPILYIVVPCYNEEEVLPISSKQFLAQLFSMAQQEKISSNSRVLFVDDGSTDRTWEIITALSESDSHFQGIRQSRNRGHQSSLLAGLMEAKDKADITISIDCDGQDDITAMDRMVDVWHDGCDIVYGVRSNRDSDRILKKATAESFYSILNWLGVESVYNHADYRLLSSRVLKELSRFKEVNLYLRGLIPLIGFKSTVVEYTRLERMAGKTHYPFSKMLSLAVDAITSLSIKPIRMITLLGLTISIISFASVIWAVVTRLVGNAVVGWASTVAIVCFIGGIQLISIGVLGEYIGKIYLEIKQRPRYIISDRTKEQ